MRDIVRLSAGARAASEPRLLVRMHAPRFRLCDALVDCAIHSRFRRIGMIVPALRVVCGICRRTSRLHTQTYGGGQQKWRHAARFLVKRARVCLYFFFQRERRLVIGHEETSRDQYETEERSLVRRQWRASFEGQQCVVNFSVS